MSRGYVVLAGRHAVEPGSSDWLGARWLRRCIQDAATTACSGQPAGASQAATLLYLSTALNGPKANIPRHRWAGGQLRQASATFGSMDTMGSQHRAGSISTTITAGNAQGMATVSLQLGGRTVQMTGDPADAYFGSVEKIAIAETPLARWADANLPQDAVMFDLGGNIGVTALLLTGLRPQGHIHVFEALPANAAFLRQNLALNGVTNCTVVEAAVGDEPGLVQLNGTGAVAQVGTAAEPGEHGVPVVTLDGYAERVGLTRLDFIKMDIEGYEPAALKGGTELIARHRPPILMEFNAWCLTHAHGFNHIAFGHALWAAFDVFQIGPDGIAVPAGNYDVSTFLHDTMVLHGAVDDVLLRPRVGGSVPRRGAASWGAVWGHNPADQVRIDQLELELDAMRRSTSWRLTRPLRAIKHALG